MTEPQRLAALKAQESAILGTLRAFDTGRRIYLAYVRRVHPELSAAEFDATLLRLQASGAIALYPLDTPWERTRTLEAAGIQVGTTRYHIAYVIQRKAAALAAEGGSNGTDYGFKCEEDAHQ